MIRNSILLRLLVELLELDHETNFGAEVDELREAIEEFFTTDEQVVGTENEGQHQEYLETLIEMLNQTAESLEELRELETDN